MRNTNHFRARRHRRPSLCPRNPLYRRPVRDKLKLIPMPSPRSTRRTFLAGISAAAAAPLVPAQEPQPSPNRAAWMSTARWGVMNHYLADWIARATHEPMTIERWNALIDHFDVEALAAQLKSVGAAYYQISIGQNSGYYLSPNAAYDRLTGITPTKCSRRDLVADLYEPLHKRGIRLMVYLPSGAPAGDAAARQALQWETGPHRNREFQTKWEAIIREWSTRWGAKVSGWWFDGCYWPNTMYRTGDAPNFATFAAAARAGNPNSAIAFNPGVFHRILSMTPDQDFTAGEIDDPALLQVKRQNGSLIDGAQIQVLSHLGQQWGMGAPRFTVDQIAGWSRKIIQEGGAITWDVPVQTVGTMPEEYITQLTALGKALTP